MKLPKMKLEIIDRIAVYGVLSFIGLGYVLDAPANDNDFLRAA